MTNNKGIYVTGCVIPNGIADHEGDILSKKEIKIIFTKYLEHQTDVQHNYIKNNGVDLVANWISETDKEIAGKTAPAGSWLATFYVTNPEIIESIYDDDPKSINGLSLGSVPKTINNTKYWFINKSINYRDLDDTEEVIPKFISFVDKPSNGFGLEIEEYSVYINKSVNEDEVEIMTNKEDTPIMDEKLSLSGWEKVIKSFQSLGINKSESGATEKEQEVKVEPVKEEKPADISNNELLEKIPEAVATGITSAFEKMGEAKKEKEEKVEPIEKAEKEVKEVKEEEIDEPAKEVKEAGVNKRATAKVENVSQPNNSTNFYQKSGRDMWGCRIQK